MILRFTNVEQWKYVDTNNMIADMGKRKGSKLNDVDKNSFWINGYEWMHNDSRHFRVKCCRDIILNQEELCEVRKEIPCMNIHDHTTKTNVAGDNYLIQLKMVPAEVRERYLFSKYVIDPIGTIIRIIPIVRKFIKILREKFKCKVKEKKKMKYMNISNPQVYISDEEIENYDVVKARHVPT